MIGALTGKLGTGIAQQNLRSVIAPQMSAPEVYIQFTPGLITDPGRSHRREHGRFLRNFMLEFEQFVARVLTVVPRPS